MEWLEILGIASIPCLCVSALIGLLFRRLEKKIDEKETARAEREYLLVKGTVAGISLGEAQARELQKDGKVNGRTDEALKYATEAKHKIEDFYTHQGVNHLQ